MRPAALLLALAAVITAPPADVTAETVGHPALPAAGLPPQTEEQQAIARTIGQLFRSVDERDWTAVRNLFTDTVQADYAAVGGEAGEMSAEDLIASWRSHLPGFDRTLHHPHRLAAWPAGDRASATCDGLALHVLGDRHWGVFTGYDFELVREADAWKIARVRVSLYDEYGDADLPAAAAARVAAGETRPLPDPTGPAAFAPVEAFFTALEHADHAGLVQSFSPDGEQVMPLAPARFPDRLAGRDAIAKQYAPVADFQSQSYPRELFATGSANVVVGRYRGEIVTSLNDAGQPAGTYDNAYLGLWRLTDDGKIASFVELFNPTILTTGFPGVAPTHYSVHPAAPGPDSGVTRTRVSFGSHGDRLAGHLFLPPGHKAGDRHRAVVVTGSWTSVKEQMPDLYAAKLAERGIAALTFDFRGFGESEGHPRSFEDSTRKTEDIRVAAGWLAGHDAVRPGGVAGLGVCASAGYLAHAAAGNDDLNAVMFIAPWLHDPAMAAELYASRPGGHQALLELGRNAQAQFDDTGVARYGQAVSELNPLAAMYVPGGVFAYYLDPARAAGPHYPNRWALQSWVPWLTFDAISAAGDVAQPVHIVHSESGAVPDGARRFIDGLPSEPVVRWLNDFTQEQLYYEADAVNAAISATADWYLAQTED